MKFCFFQKYLDDNNLDYKNDSQDRIFLLQVKKSIIKKSNNSSSLLAHVSSHTVLFLALSLFGLLKPTLLPTHDPPTHATNLEEDWYHIQKGGQLFPENIYTSYNSPLAWNEKLNKIRLGPWKNCETIFFLTWPFLIDYEIFNAKN